MTLEYTPGDIAMIVRCLRAQTEGPGPICPVCVHQAGLVAYDEQSGNRITDAGRVVLAIAAERDDERAKAATAAGDFVTMLERISRELNAALAETQEVKEKLRGEVELWRLRCEWQEARFERADAALELSSAAEEGASPEAIDQVLSVLANAEMAEDQAEAAYVAAGGEV